MIKLIKRIIRFLEWFLDKKIVICPMCGETELMHAKWGLWCPNIHCNYSIKKERG